MDFNEVTKEIVQKLVDKNVILMDQFPTAETYVDAVCQTYEKIYDTVYKAYTKER